jgi:hypothetical protein
MGPQQNSSPLLPLLFQSHLPLRYAPSMGLCHDVRHVFTAGERSCRRRKLFELGVPLFGYLPITEEATMVAIPKIIGVMCCGVVLCLGLSTHTVSATDVMTAGHAGDRIGGHAGRGFEHVKREPVAAPRPGERIGGQAGRGFEQQKREPIVAHAGERIGGQAGLGETGTMSK